MGHFKDRVQDATRAWQDSSRKPDLLWTGLSAGLAGTWAGKQGRSADRVIADEVAEFIAASVAQTDMDDVWSERRNCEACGERYKLENMSTCIECGKTLCWRCSSAYASGSAAGGIFYTCPACGGEMV